jgi:A118 family predicted phage portal protein
MPLPASGTPWPPKRLASIHASMAEWDAWYTGAPDALRNAYQGSNQPRVINPNQLAGGVVGAVARFWWGRPTTDPAVAERGQLHIPVASDMCQAVADLLFAEPPTIRHEDSATTDRLKELVDDHLLTTLAEAAEIGAALSGVFLRVTWDRAKFPAGPFITTVHADGADPEFTWGRLTAVTFWTVVQRDGDKTWRHLERHELDSAGNGVILHGLYQGTGTDLGRLVPLTEAPATSGLADVVDEESTISTASPGLAVVYVPNIKPQRRWRKDPAGKDLGRSVLDGVEPLMDALDETWSSWMRDIRLGKARVIVARSLLESNGPGQGATFDMDRELFTEVNALAPRDSSGLPLEQVQFDIRVAEHQQTTAELLRLILRTAGFSAQTFGDSTDAAATATEVTARERRSFMTRDRMIRLWKPSLADLMQKLLAVDNAAFGKHSKLDDAVKVEFPDGVQEAPETLATTANLLNQAAAASTKVKVEMVHPDWDTKAVEDEVALILAEQGMAVPNPDARLNPPVA